MLRFRADLRPLGFNALYFALSALAFWPGLALPLAVRVVIFAVLCVTSFQGAVQTHNAVHSPVFKTRWMNKIYQVVLTLTYGHPVSSYVPGHNLSHHKHTQKLKDIMRTSKARFRWNLLNGLFFFFLVTPGIMAADLAYTKSTRRTNPRWFRQAKIEMAVLQLVQVSLLAWSWFGLHDLWRFVFFWFIPHTYAAWGIVTMNLIQHDGCDEDSEYNHSRNFVGGVVNWLVFNNGFHTVHHHQPGLHWSLTPAAHEKLVAPHIHSNLDQGSLLGYIWRTYFLNRRLDYLGNPVVLPPAGKDEPWIPRPEETRGDLGVEDVDAGSEALANAVAHRPLTQA